MLIIKSNKAPETANEFKSIPNIFKNKSPKKKKINVSNEHKNIKMLSLQLELSFFQFIKIGIEPRMFITAKRVNVELKKSDIICLI